MAGHAVRLAALLAQAKVQAVVLAIHIANVHRERRADPGEGVEHRSDARALPATQVARIRRILAMLRLARQPRDMDQGSTKIPGVRR